MKENTVTDNDFARAGVGRGGSRGNIVREFLAFMGANKKWWLAPIIAVILLLGLLVIAAGTGAAPFIYSLF